MIVYHGSNVVVNQPDLKHSRKEIDFGRGFYLTEDYAMACKWVSNKQVGIVNKYELDIDSLRVVQFDLSIEWLNYVTFNRKVKNATLDESGVDVVIGATADDNLFDTLRDYWKQKLSPELAVEYLNVMGFSRQIVLKTTEALAALHFMGFQELTPKEMKKWYDIRQFERAAAKEKLQQYKYEKGELQPSVEEQLRNFHLRDVNREL